MEHHRRIQRLGALFSTAALAAACGGGGSDAAAPPPPPPPPSSVDISGRAVDGPLQGAIACYDLNDNRVCDGNDPRSAATGADGRFTISVATAEAGKHRTIVEVPATAIDADTGAAVGRAFVLVAPASNTAGAQTVFVSPLTTLVAQQMDKAGQSKDQAVAFVQGELGLAVSPLADFTAAGNADNTKAANSARLAVATEKLQATALAAAVGQADLSGGSVSQADVDAQVKRAVVASLPAIGTAAADVALAGKTGNELAAAVNTLAAAVVVQAGVTVPEVVAAVGVSKLPPEPSSSDAPAPGAVLAAFRYASPNDWYARSFQASAADNTLDGGFYRSVEVRTRAETYNFAAGSPVTVSWGFNNDPTRAGDQWWDGSAWVGCPLGTRNPGTPRDANGRSSYSYCNNFEKGTSVRSAVDIAGQSMSTVLTQKIRTVPGGSGGVNFADWGPTDLGLLGTATFPAGSKLYYQTTTPLESALAYAARDVDQVTVYPQDVADGGDNRIGAKPCGASNLAAPVAATSLEQMIARNRGTPCVFAPATNADGTSLDPNEAWFAAAVSLTFNVADYWATLPAGTGNYYTNEGRMRVSFTGSGNGTVYYACYTRRTPASTRNCQVKGTGTYTITQLGDARVMSLNNVPIAGLRGTFNRLFVERGGKVYFGYKNFVGQDFPQVRLNMTAANAMFYQLRLPAIQPSDAPNALTGAKAATAATLKGIWGSADANGAAILRFGDNGKYVMAQAGAAEGGGRSGLEEGYFDFDPATGVAGVLIESDSNAEWGLSHPQPNDGITGITADRISLADGSSVSRFVDDPNGIVGVWSIEPANLKMWSLVFFANGKVLEFEPRRGEAGACTSSRNDPPGVEWASYTFDAGTGALNVFGAEHDTNGCVGFFNPVAAVPTTSFSALITLAADGKSFSFTRADGSRRTYFRVPTGP